MDNEASKCDKLKIERYMIRKDWKINGEMTNDFLSKFYGKTFVLYNLRYLLDPSKLNPCLEDTEGNIELIMTVSIKWNKLK